MSAHLGHGKLCHLTLPATDVEASARFYESLFAWRVRRTDGGPTFFDDGVGEVSGHFDPRREPSDTGLLVYLWVDDLAAALDALRAAGAEIVAEPGVDPGERTALFRDPGGNVLGVYQEPAAT